MYIMVLSSSKWTSHTDSICNRQNVCGGPKKAGTGPNVGWFMTSNPGIRGAPKSVPLSCVVSMTVQTQKYGYSATHGGNMG